MPETYPTDHRGIALDGYDPVSFTCEGGPRAGSPELHHDWAGATWIFSSPENAARFAADPQTYAPRFGGRCAFGAAFSASAAGSPTAWRIIDGRLYLMKDRAVRLASRLVTGRIRRADTP